MARKPEFKKDLRTKSLEAGRVRRDFERLKKKGPSQSIHTSTRVLEAISSEAHLLHPAPPNNHHRVTNFDAENMILSIDAGKKSQK